MAEVMRPTRPMENTETVNATAKKMINLAVSTPVALRRGREGRADHPCRLGGDDQDAQRDQADLAQYGPKKAGDVRHVAEVGVLGLRGDQEADADHQEQEDAERPERQRTDLIFVHSEVSAWPRWVGVSAGSASCTELPGAACQVGAAAACCASGAGAC